VFAFYCSRTEVCLLSYLCSHHTLTLELDYLFLSIIGQLSIQCSLSIVRALRLSVLVYYRRPPTLVHVPAHINLSPPAISAVSPTRDRFAFLRNGLVEMSERRSFGPLLAQVGFDPLSGHHDAGLVLLRDVDPLLQRLLAEEGWEAVEWGKVGVAAIGVGELDRRAG